MSFTAIGVRHFDPKLMLDRHDDFEDINGIQAQAALGLRERQRGFGVDGLSVYVMKIYGFYDDVDNLFNELVFVHGLDYI